MPPGSLFWRAVSYATLAFSLASFLVTAWNIRPIPPAGSDGLIYHLTLPAYWLRAGYLAPVDLPFHDGAAEHSPALTETIYFLLMRLAGDDRLVWVVQPAFSLAVCRLYYLSVRLCGLTADAARIATAAVVIFPPYCASAALVNSDMVLTFGASLFCYGVLQQRLRPEGGLLRAASGIAVLLSSKYIGVVYVAAAVLVFAVTLLSRSRPQGERRLRPHVVAAATAIVVAGCSFHLRNWIRQGNPVYPAEISIGDFRLFPGLYRSSVLVNHGWSREALADLLVHSESPFGVLFPLSLFLWIGPIALLIARVTGKLRRRDLGPIVVVLGFPAASLALYLLVTPFWREHRLLFPVYYSLLLCTGFAISLLRRYGLSASGRTAVAAALFSAYLAVQLLIFFPAHLLPIGGLGAAAGACLAFGLRGRRGGRPVRIAMIALTAVGLCGALLAPPDEPRCELRQGYYAAVYEARGEAWAMIDSLTAARGGTVAYAGTPLTFPLFGCRLQNRVVYVPVSRDDRPVPVELRPGDSVDRRLSEARRGDPDEAFWSGGLRREGVDLLLVVEQPDVGSPELEFVRRSPDRFTRLFSREGVSLYRVRGDAG